MTYYFKNFTIGYKYKMSNLQTALGLAQLERIKILIKKRDRYLNGITIFLKIIV